MSKAKPPFEILRFFILRFCGSLFGNSKSHTNTAAGLNTETRNLETQCLTKRPEQPISRILFPIRVTPNRATIIHLWMPVARHLLRPTRELGRATLKRSPIWSCTGWGLPSFPGHPENWCALTAPFHPYPAINAGRYIFCCTFLRVATTSCYEAPCPVVFGLSSGPTR